MRPHLGPRHDIIISSHHQLFGIFGNQFYIPRSFKGSLAVYLPTNLGRFQTQQVRLARKSLFCAHRRERLNHLFDGPKVFACPCKLGGDGGWASLSQNADAMYQHAYGVRNPMHGTLNIQVSNSASQVGTQISFLRASA